MHGATLDVEALLREACSDLVGLAWCGDGNDHRLLGVEEREEVFADGLENVVDGDRLRLREDLRLVVLRNTFQGLVDEGCQSLYGVSEGLWIANSDVQREMR